MYARECLSWSDVLPGNHGKRLFIHFVPWQDLMMRLIVAVTLMILARQVSTQLHFAYCDVVGQRLLLYQAISLERICTSLRLYAQVKV